MKDVLEYTKEELEALSTDELAVLHKKAEYQESLFDTRQLVEKLAINSLYGALGNRWFPLFNQDIARAITGNGRYFIHKLANYIDDELQSREASDKSYVIYGDTDSVVGTTIINTTHGDVKIEDLYDNLDGEVEIRGDNNFIKHVTTDIEASSVSNVLTHQNKPIKYVMKHKVKKRMFKIKCDGEEVQVTEDHSIMVLRDGKLTSTKPLEIKQGDKLIKQSY